MFYYPTVLKRHTGCFSTIWLVATKGIKVPRRDFLKVNIKTTCDDIMNYILVRIPPPQPGLPQPRFSLYLSSQLQYGLVLVFHRQCAILLEELQSILSQLLKQRSSQKINLDDSSRPAVALPNDLSLMEEMEGAPDPLFGEMDGVMPSPTALLQMTREYLREVSPELPELTASSAPQLQGITASPATITLRETEPVAIPDAEFEGEDLGEHLSDVIDFLLAEAGHFPEESVELPPEEVIPQEKEDERGDERGKTKELTGSTTELQPATVSSEGAALLPQEEPEPPAETPGPLRDELTPVSAPVLPSPPSAGRKRPPKSPELEGVHPEVKRRKRRRQLVFFDPETQIPQNELQQQIDDPLTEIRPLTISLPSSQRIIPASELFGNPCSFIPDEIRSLWRRAATITPLPGSDLRVGERGPESSDSERDREREMMEVAEREEQRVEEIPTEIPRQMEEPEEFDISAGGTLSLEASGQRDVSREISPVYTSDREGSIISRSAPTLQDIPELEREVIDGAAAESPGLLPDLAEHEEESVLFQSLFPPEANRRTVSSTFQRLLENLSSRRIRAEQDEPYGDILLFPASNYQDQAEI